MTARGALAAGAPDLGSAARRLSLAGGFALGGILIGAAAVHSPTLAIGAVVGIAFIAVSFRSLAGGVAFFVVLTLLRPPAGLTRHGVHAGQGGRPRSRARLVWGAGRPPLRGAAPLPRPPVARVRDRRLPHLVAGVRALGRGPGLRARRDHAADPERDPALHRLQRDREAPAPALGAGRLPRRRLPDGGRRARRGLVLRAVQSLRGHEPALGRDRRPQRAGGDPDPGRRDRGLPDPDDARAVDALAALLARAGDLACPLLHAVARRPPGAGGGHRRHTAPGRPGTTAGRRRDPRNRRAGDRLLRADCATPGDPARDEVLCRERHRP